MLYKEEFIWKGKLSAAIVKGCCCQGHKENQREQRVI